jgi:chaperonin GroES
VAKAKKKVQAKSKLKTSPKTKAKAKTKEKTKAKAKTKSKEESRSKSPALKKVSVSTTKTAKPSKPSVRPVDVSDFVTPLDDRVIVQVQLAERVTPGGLIIPDTVSQVGGNRQGVVVAVGRGHRDSKGRVRPMDVVKGDQILFPDHAGAKIEYQGQDLLILRETDVMGVVN